MFRNAWLRTLIWLTCLLAGLLTAVLCVLSTRWFVWVKDRAGSYAGIAQGSAWCAYVWEAPPAQYQSHGDWRFGKHTSASYWWFHLDRSPGGQSTMVIVPLWAPGGALLLAGAALCRRDVLARRRQQSGCCAGCGYSRTGIPAGAACPECGAAAPTATAADAT